MRIKLNTDANGETKVLILPEPKTYTLSYQKKGAEQPKDYTISTPISAKDGKITAYVYAGKDTKPGIRTFVAGRIVDFT